MDAMSTAEPAGDDPREQLAREAAAAYEELTRQAEALPPDRAQAILRVRDFVAGFAAYYTAMDRRLGDQEQITDLFLGQDLPLLATLLRNRLTTAQRRELAGLITEA